VRAGPIEIDWRLIAIALTIPPMLAVLTALPFWRRNISTYGAVTGTGLLALAALAFFLWDGITVTRTIAACDVAGVPCPVRPGVFVRFAIFGFIAMGQGMLLFVIDLRLERRRQQREFASEWRR